MATLSARKYDRRLQGNMIRRRGLEVAWEGGSLRLPCHLRGGLGNCLGRRDPGGSFIGKVRAKVVVAFSLGGITFIVRFILL